MSHRNVHRFALARSPRGLARRQRRVLAQNHKRHVKAGIKCQDCHGPVETMPVVYQVPSLRMGWCVSCHRSKLDDPKFPASMDCLVCHH